MQDLAKFIQCFFPPQASPSKGYTVFHWLANMVRGHLTHRSEGRRFLKHPTLVRIELAVADGIWKFPIFILHVFIKRYQGAKQNSPAMLPLSTMQLQCGQLKHPLPKLENVKQ